MIGMRFSINGICWGIAKVLPCSCAFAHLRRGQRRSHLEVGFAGECGKRAQNEWACDLVISALESPAHALRASPQKSKDRTFAPRG